MCRMISCWGILAGAVLLLAGGGRAGASELAELSAVGGPAGRSLMGSGSGVKIAVLDGGIDAWHPALAGSITLQRDFTGEGRIDDDPTGHGHATGIAGLVAGHAWGYTGLAPASKLLNGRIIDSRDYTTDSDAAAGLFWAARSGAAIVNLSIGNVPRWGPVSDRFSLMVDYAVERYGLSVLAAAGNENESAVDYTPGGSYNGYSIGALMDGRYNRVSDFSNYAMGGDRRTKPDLVAPGVNVRLAAADWERSDDYMRADGTSFAAPIAGGVLAQMLGYGRARGLPTNPVLLKAILMAGATKVYDYDGAPWSPRHKRIESRGLVYDQPLDEEQGAGRVDAAAAYAIYARKASSAAPVANWKLSSMAGGGTYTMKLGELQAGQRVDATLAWLRHVGWRDDGDGVVDAGDRFWQSASLADFGLTLLRNGKPVVLSDSDYDNTEHLSWRLKDDGYYALLVERYEGSGAAKESFALAARVLSGTSKMRPLGAAPTESALAGGGVSQGLGDAASVPEPGAAVLLAAAAWLLVRRRK